MSLKTFHHKTVEILRIYTEVLDFIMLFSTNSTLDALSYRQFLIWVHDTLFLEWGHEKNHPQ